MYIHFVNLIYFQRNIIYTNDLKNKYKDIIESARDTSYYAEMLTDEQESDIRGEMCSAHCRMVGVGGSMGGCVPC